MSRLNVEIIRANLRMRRWLVVVGFLVLLCLCFLGWVILTPQDDFCTTQDEVYQIIQAEHVTWLDLLSDTSRTVDFTTAQGEKYIAYRAWNIPGISTFIVQTEPARQEPYGARGYIYAPTKDSTLDSRYYVQHLGNNIYCYTFK